MCPKCFLVKTAYRFGWENYKLVRWFIGGRWELWRSESDHPLYSKLEFWVADGYVNVPGYLAKCVKTEYYVR